MADINGIKCSCLLLHSGETEGKSVMQIWNSDIGFKKLSRHWLWCNIMDIGKQLCEGRCIEQCKQNMVNPSGYDHNSLCNIWIGIILLLLQNWDWVHWYYLTSQTYASWHFFDLWRICIYLRFKRYKFMQTVVSVPHWTVGLLQWKMGFKSPNFYLKSKRLQVFFVLSQMAQWSFGWPVFALEGDLSCPEEVQRPFQRPFGPLVQLA